MTLRLFSLRTSAGLLLCFATGVFAQAKPDISAGKVEWPAD